MRNGWEIRNLGDVSENLDSQRKPITKRNRIGGPIPYYGATGIVDYINDHLFNEKLVLLGEDGAKWSSGDKSAFIINGKTWVNNHAHVLKPNRKILSDEWLVYNLNYQDLSPYISGMTVPKLNQGRMNEIPIPLPPLSEQKRIVAILDEAFAAIDRAKANVEKNLQNARELFESYLQGVFGNPGADWEEKKLGDIAKLIDSLHKTPKYVENGYPMVRVTDIKPGELNLAKAKQVDRETFIEFSKKHLPKIGDIVFSRVGSYGVSSIVTSDKPFCLGQNTVFIIPKIDYQYFYFFLNSPNAKKQFDKMVAGTTQPTISLKNIKEIVVPIPKSHEQRNLVAKLKSSSLATQNLESLYYQKLNNLEELKKSILKKAFAGELTKSNESIPV